MEISKSVELQIQISETELVVSISYIKDIILLLKKNFIFFCILQVLLHDFELSFIQSKRIDLKGLTVVLYEYKISYINIYFLYYFCAIKYI